MKVYLGPYYHWLRPAKWYKDWILWAYGFGYKCDYEKINVEKLDKLTDRIHDSWIYNNLMRVERWFSDRYERKIDVKIDYYDIWGMYDTLALIVLPMLKLLKEKKQGAPYVDDADVPEHLRSTACPPTPEFHTDDNHFKRWEWVMDEMIWAFEQLLNDDADSQFHYDLDPAKPRHEPGISFQEMMRRGGFDKEGAEAFQQRKTRGFTLFGKYFEALWD